jgi:hypothetical protein
LSCIQDCTKNILTRVVNPEYERLGDAHYTPEIILSTWFQAETGRIPVTGAGYGGPFSGPGFDSMWTDMSEIVRPTRDGIHGREYINTSVDIGRRPAHLVFEQGELKTPPFPLLEVPLPVIFDAIPAPWNRGNVVEAAIRAAAQIGLFSIVPRSEIPAGLSVEADQVLPRLEAGDTDCEGGLAGAAMLVVEDQGEIASVLATIEEQNADQIVAIRVTASPAAAGRIGELVHKGAEVVQLVFDHSGRETEAEKPRHMRDVLRQVHGSLVQEGLRDQVTIIASGGVALAEHMAKAIICGADLVAIDIPLVLALECRLCRECERDEDCPVSLGDIETTYAAQRIINLMGAWHLQLVEMLGAMGIREVRRLRGEMGRCMFIEDLERESFGRLFGKRKEESLPV